MANAQPLTLTQAQNLIHTQLEGDTDTPGSSDDDYKLRTALINRFITDWENTRGVLWNELWDTDDSNTVSTGTTTYGAPTDFKFPGGYVRLVDSDGNTELIPVDKPEQVQRYTSEQRRAYFTGNPSNGYTLNLLWTPTSKDNGKTIKYDYYKYATKLETGTDEIEMSNPMFVIDSVIAEVRQIEFRLDAYQIHASRAQSHLQQMIESNDLDGHYQMQGVEDIVDIEFGV